VAGRALDGKSMSTKKSETTKKITKYKPYPAYVDSGVEWLGKIPEGWKVDRAGYLYSEMELPPPEDAGVVTAYRDGEVTLRENRRAEGYTFAIQEVGYQGVRNGDLVIQGMDAFAGAIGVSDSDGKCSPEYLVLEPVRSEIENHYYAALLRVMAKRDYILVICNAVRERAPRFRYPEFKNVFLPIPSGKEQRSIIAFLDRSTAKIDAFLAKYARLLGFLAEKRSALITRAVTKGLDTDAPMVDSGVEWLGEIPEGWDIKKMRYSCFISEGQVSPNDAEYSDRILIAPNHVESGTGKILYYETCDEQAAISGKYLVRKGELIYSKIRPHLNKVAIATGDWLCSADMYPIYISDNRLVLKYLHYFMLSECFVYHMADESMRVAMPKINRDVLYACNVLVPSNDEQEIIIKTLDRETAKIDALVAKVERSVELLKEYRVALISAAVTGKIDLREE
jgi:type I restriction enzyme, S subunit